MSKQTLLDNCLIPNVKFGSSDIFQTPPEAIDYLIPYLPKDIVVWESASGYGLLAKRISEHGYLVTVSDIIDGNDFFKYEPKIRWDVQITNPPYSIKDEWLERSYELGKPFALLLPVNALHSVKRCRMFREKGLQLVIPPRRINFVTPSGEGSGAWFPVMWFCYGLNLENDLNFAEETND
jgi:hypothetical protein